MTRPTLANGGWGTWEVTHSQKWLCHEGGDGEMNSPVHGREHCRGAGGKARMVDGGMAEC